MGNCIRTEMWKAFHNKMMRSALLIGFILVIADLVQTAITVSDLGASYAHSPGGYDGCSLFVNWIGVNGVTVGAVVFYAVWPFLAAMPYGWSLYEDNRSHMTNNILTRVPYSQYLTAKMAAVFVSGGIAIALPVTADLFASAMICPACIPRVTLPITGFCSGTAFLAKLYYTHPWLHAIIWCVIEFFWGGVAASLCIIVGHKVKHRFFVIATPLLLLRLMCGLIYATEGSVSVNDRRLGKDLDFPESVGVMIESPAFIDEYTGQKNLELLAGLKQLISASDIHNTLQAVGLDPNDKRTFKKYSLGMKQRLGIAAALMEKPDLLILDEPTNALDEQGVAMIAQLIRKECQCGALVVVACHDADFVQSVSDVVIQIQAGRVTSVIGK